jgi:hypothetical protein
LPALRHGQGEERTTAKASITIAYRFLAARAPFLPYEARRGSCGFLGSRYRHLLRGRAKAAYGGFAVLTGAEDRRLA